MTRFNLIQNAFQFGEISTDCYGRQDLAIWSKALASVKNFIPQPMGGLKKRDCFKITNIGSAKPFYASNGTTYYLTTTGIYTYSAGVFTLYQTGYNEDNTQLSANLTNTTQYGDVLVIADNTLFPKVVSLVGGTFYYGDMHTILKCDKWKIIPFNLQNTDPSILITCTNSSPLVMGDTSVILATKSSSSYPIFEFDYDSYSKKQFLSGTWATPSLATNIFEIRPVLSQAYFFLSAPTTDIAADGTVTLPSITSFVTGDKFKVTLTYATNTVVTYQWYIIRLSSTQVKFADSWSNAIAGTSVSSSYFSNLKSAVSHNFKAIAISGVIGTFLEKYTVKADGTTSGISHSSAGTSVWAFSPWGGVSGYPSVVYSTGDRLAFASTLTKGDTHWFSLAGNITIFSKDVLAQDATADVSGYNYYGTDTNNLRPFNVFSSDTETSRIYSASSFSDVVCAVGSRGFYTIVRGNAGYKAGEVSSAKLSSLGGTYHTVTDNSLVYISGNKLHRFTPSSQVPVTTLNVMNTDLFTLATKIKYIASRSLLVVLADGKLYTCCLYDGASTIAFSRLECTPVSNSIIDFEIVEDKIYFTTFALGSFIEDVTETLDAKYNITLGVAGKVFSVVVTGINPALYDLYYTNRTSVVYYLDGVKVTATMTFDVPTQTLTITTLVNGTSLDFGFLNIPYLKTLPIEAGSQLGTSQGCLKRIDEVAIKIKESDHALVGSKDTNLETVKLPTTNYTGERVQKFTASPDNNSQVIITQNAIGKLYITGLIMKGLEVD